MSTELLFDVLWLVPTIPALYLLVRARAQVIRSIKKYRGESSRSKLSGSQVARILLDAAGLPLVPIEEIDGDLTDHYDRRHHALRLTSHVLHESSIAAVGIATHEVGHALQHHTSYWPLLLRTWVVPAAVLLPPLGLLLIIAGVLMPAHELTWVGTALFLTAILLAIAVLPVEKDASRRGLELLERRRIVDPEDVAGIRAVLEVSPLTYLALTIAAFGQLVYVGLKVAGIARKPD